MFSKNISGKFIFGRGEALYNEVIDDFESTRYIGIVSFDITAKDNSDLLNRLKAAAKKGVNIELITNIPKRYEQYFYTSDLRYERAAQKSINSYLNALDPDKYGDAYQAFFCFFNHSKIIVTDNKLYWGSSNFSDASEKSYECGTLSDDKDTIKFIKEVILPEIKKSSVPYYNFNLIDEIYYLRRAKSVYERLCDEIIANAFKPAAGEFNYSDNWKYCARAIVLSSQVISAFENIAYNAYKVFNRVEKVIIEYENDIRNELNFHEDVEKLRNAYNKYKELYEYNLEELQDILDGGKADSTFDTSDEASNRLISQYGMEAYDEYLEDYMDNIMQEVFEEYDEMVENSEETVRDCVKSLLELLKTIEEILDAYLSVIRVNRRIDNTGLKATEYKSSFLKKDEGEV